MFSLKERSHRSELAIRMSACYVTSSLEPEVKRATHNKRSKQMAATLQDLLLLVNLMILWAFFVGGNVVVVVFNMMT